MQEHKVDTYFVLSKNKATTNTERKDTWDEDNIETVNPSQNKRESNKIEIQTDEFIFTAETYKDDISIEDDVFIDDSITTSPHNILDKKTWKPEIPFENVT